MACHLSILTEQSLLILIILILMISIFSGKVVYFHTSTAPAPLLAKNALATALLHPGKNEISQRQQAIKELSHHLEFRQHLQAHGSLLDTKEKELQATKDMAGGQACFYQ